MAHFFVFSFYTIIRTLSFYNQNINNIFILIYKDLYSYKEDNPTDKNIKQVNNIKSNAIVVFKADKKYSILVDDMGINYLEFNQNSAIKTRVYNARLLDIHEIYKIEGDNLFKDNVRKGINTKQKEKKALINSFTNFFLTTLIFNLKKLDKWNNDMSGLKNEFIEWIENKLDVVYEENNYYQLPNSFWYKHNGITIVTTNKNAIKYERNLVNVISSKLQIVNGAQTISAWSNIFYEVFKLESTDSKLYKYISQALQTTIDNISVKVIFMIINEYKKENIRISPQDIVNEITIGLNTQISVTRAEVFMKESSELIELNKYISEIYHIRIGKMGDQFDNIQVFTLKNFVQSWLIYTGQPGQARNLAKDYVTSDKTIENLFKFIREKEAEPFINFLKNQDEIDRWWKSRAKNSDKSRINKEMIDSGFDQDDFISAISSNGLNHFKAFLIKNKLLESMLNDDDNITEGLNYSYKKFLKVFKDKIIDADVAKKPYNSNMFKGKDTVIFNKLIFEQGDKKNQIDLLAINDDFKSNNINPNYKSGNNSFINNWLIENKYKLENVRTVSCTQGNVNESFPLMNTSFTNLVEKLNNGENVTFQKSDFFKEISKEYNIFIFDKIDDNNTVIKYMKTNFADGKLTGDAEEVFNIVVEAIETGNKDKLVKESDDKSFHIRPKARNAADVMMFSDNEYITKQTFWVNKAVINNLINSKAIGPRQIIK